MVYVCVTENAQYGDSLCILSYCISMHFLLIFILYEHMDINEKFINNIWKIMDDYFQEEKVFFQPNRDINIHE